MTKSPDIAPMAAASPVNWTTDGLTEAEVLGTAILGTEALAGLVTATETEEEI
jgi:hypothetical protein